MNNKLSRAAGLNMLGSAWVAVMVLGFFVLNIALYLLSGHLGLVYMTAPDYSHRISDSTVAAVDRLSTDISQVNIYFCMPPEELQRDQVYDLVYQTALQYAERLDFVSVGHLSIYTDPASVDRYKYDPDTGDKTSSVTRSSVIVDSGDRFTLAALSSFFLLDENRSIVAYYGEEVMSAMLRRSLTEDMPTAYYTTGHGENLSTSLMNMLICAGYDLEEIDLMDTDPEDTDGLLLISAPSYDFATGAEGVISEIQRIERFISDGGRAMILLDPLADRLTNLYEMCARMGLTPGAGIVRDTASGITSDGFTLVLDYAGSTPAAGLRQTVTSHSDGRVIAREASAVTVTEAEGYTASALLVSSPTSAAYQDGEQVSGAGSFPICAVSEKQGGGSLLLCSSYYITASDALHSNGYSNKQFFFALLDRYGSGVSSIGSTVMPLEQTVLEDLTFGSARLWAVLLCVAVPAGVAAAGTVVMIRRKNK